jgi:hypothetical protein
LGIKLEELEDAIFFPNILSMYWVYHDILIRTLSISKWNYYSVDCESISSDTNAIFFRWPFCFIYCPEF